MNQENFTEIKNELKAHFVRACRVPYKINQHQDIF